MEDDLPGPGIRGLPPGQEFIRDPDSQGGQEKTLGRLTGQMRRGQHFPQVVVQGVARAARLIQVNLRRQPWRWPASLAGGSQIEVCHLKTVFSFRFLVFGKKSVFRLADFTAFWEEVKI
jgi:hypothetical protein